MSDLKDNIMLVNLAKSGDINAFEELIADCEKIVFNIALKMIPTYEDAKDISQEVFIKVYKNLEKFDGKSAFSTWVYRITVNTCIDFLRKTKNTVSLDNNLEFEDGSHTSMQYKDTSPTPEEQAIKNEKKSEIENAINHLSFEHKLILTLRDIQGLSYNEISEITNLSLGTVKSRLARARNSLKNILTDKMERFKNNKRQNK